MNSERTGVAMDLSVLSRSLLVQGNPTRCWDCSFEFRGGYVVER
jgi:hypothetical protein